jgi:AcrR family transcriptional regulator
LRAAREVFAAHGYHGATVAEITAAADVAVGTFYLYFQDKDEALSALLAEGLHTLGDEIRAAVEPLPPERTIPTVLRTIFGFAYVQRDLFRIALTGAGQHALALDAQRRLADSVGGALEDGRRHGLLAGYDTALLGRFITGIVTQGIVWWFEHDTPDPEGMARQALLLLRGGLPHELLVLDEPSDRDG